MTTSRTVRLHLNGVSTESTVEVRKTLADFLREDCRATGTHLGCEHGVCGACTVLYNGQPIRSCLMLAVQADGAEITTVEGLSPDGRLGVIPQSMKESYAFQCGFCTPGFLISIAALLENEKNPDEDQIRESLSGNICRCTGYESIINGVLTALANHED